VNDEGKSERDLNLLLAVNFVTIELRGEFFDNGVDLWSQLDQEKKILDDDLSDSVVGLNITKSFEERRLKLRNHRSHHGGSLRKHQPERQEDLDLEIWWELIIDYTNQCTTDLDNLSLDGHWASKVNEILEAISTINPDPN